MTIEELKFEIEVYREIIKEQEDDKKFNSENLIIDENLKKSPQKHKIWNGIVSGAVKELNPYCHNENCDSGLDCKKTHEKTYKIIANLLKIIYPTIWKENIKTIADRIKQKDYRQL